MESRRIIKLLLITLLVSASVVSAATINTQGAQSAPDVSGKYEGVAKSADQGEIPLIVEIKNDSGKVTGKIDTTQGSLMITSGSYAEGELTLKFEAGGNAGTVTARPDGDRIVGEWELGGARGTIELKRVGAAAAPAPAAAAKPEAGDPLTGEWEGAAEIQGQSIPFTMNLKLEGDKVTGTTSAGEGPTSISKGSWVGEKLSFALETGQGIIALTATIKDGKLVGEYDFAGQMKGAWQAKRK